MKLDLARLSSGTGTRPSSTSTSATPLTSPGPGRQRRPALPAATLSCTLQVWTENNKDRRDFGAVNFITGMGGFLQAVINGYFGVRKVSPVAIFGGLIWFLLAEFLMRN